MSVLYLFHAIMVCLSVCLSVLHHSTYRTDKYNADAGVLCNVATLGVVTQSP